MPVPGTGTGSIIKAFPFPVPQQDKDPCETEIIKDHLPHLRLAGDDPRAWEKGGDPAAPFIEPEDPLAHPKQQFPQRNGGPQKKASQKAGYQKHREKGDHHKIQDQRPGRKLEEIPGKNREDHQIDAEAGPEPLAGKSLEERQKKQKPQHRPEGKPEAAVIDRQRPPQKNSRRRKGQGSKTVIMPSRHVRPDPEEEHQESPDHRYRQPDHHHV